MRPAAAWLLLGALTLPACASRVADPQPTVERELAAALEERRLRGIEDRVLIFIDGLAREGADLGRIDRVDRAAAARASAGSLRGELGAVHRGRLDREGRVDLDLALFLIARAEAEIGLADLDEPLIAAWARPAERALAMTESPVPAADALRAAAGIAAPADAPPPARTAADLRAAASRLRQGAERLRNAGDAVAVLYAAEGGNEHREAARAAADRFEGQAKDLDERSKALPGGGDGGFAPACGRERFVSLLRTRHGVDKTPEELEEAGRALLARTTKDLEELAAAHFPGRTWREALEVIRDDHASAASMPGEARVFAEQARDFCLERGLVTIPPAARLGHVELVGDGMARSYPFAAYSWRRATTEGESGRYMVSPGATWMDADQKEQRLRGNCRAWTRVVSAHETWPGHHLQFWVADHDTSPLRRAAGSDCFVEGWGLYCEALLDRHGYFTTPAERLALLAMRAWRASRVVLDVRLHCMGMTPEEGIAFLVENAASTKDGATAEVTRYMGNPTQPFSYATGWAEIESLRADEEGRLGPDFSERAFHDRLLRCGPVPFRFVRQSFGYARDEGTVP